MASKHPVFRGKCELANRGSNTFAIFANILIQYGSVDPLYCSITDILHHESFMYVDFQHKNQILRIAFRIKRHESRISVSFQLTCRIHIFLVALLFASLSGFFFFQKKLCCNVSSSLLFHLLVQKHVFKKLGFWI